MGEKMSRLYKDKKQRAFSLLEVVFVIVFFTLGTLGGMYYLHQEREFTTANLVARQLAYIADCAAKYSWPISESNNAVQTYNLLDLQKMGVISSKNKYNYDYNITLYRQDGHTYDVLVFIKKEPDFSIEQLISISGLIGEDGGYTNGSGNIIMSSSHLYSDIKYAMGEQGEITKNTPIILKRINNVNEIPPAIRNIRETLFEWGKVKENNHLDNLRNLQSVSWCPAFVDDRVIISWDIWPKEVSSTSKYLATVTVKNKNNSYVFSRTINFGTRYVLIPKMAWVGKSISVSLFIEQGINSKQITRVYNIKKADFSGNVDVEATFRTYVLNRDYTLSPIIEGFRKNSLRNGSPYIVCLGSFSMKTHSEIINRVNGFLMPITYDVYLDYFSGYRSKVFPFKTNVTAGVISLLPYSVEQTDNPDYKSIGSKRCVVFSRSNSEIKVRSTPRISISVDLNKEDSQIIDPMSGGDSMWTVSWN